MQSTGHTLGTLYMGMVTVLCLDNGHNPWSCLSHQDRDSQPFFFLSSKEDFKYPQSIFSQSTAELWEKQQTDPRLPSRGPSHLN